MKNAGKACNNRLYRHIRTFEKIVKNYFVIFLKQECCPRAHKNRTIRMNQELTAIHQEVLQNLESIHGALLRMNRSIQSEGTFGVLKWDKAYKRLLRRGEKNVILELTLISCGFNLYKYHNKKQRQTKVA